MASLQRRLRHARVVAMKLDDRGRQSRVVTGIAEDDCQRRPVLPVDAKHVNGVIDRSERNELDAPICGKGRFVPRVRKLRRPQLRQRCSYNRGELVFKLRGVCANVCQLLRGQPVGDRELLIDDRAAMRVTGIEEKVRTPQLMTTLNERGDAVGHASGDAQEIDGDEHRRWLLSALQRERFRMQRHRDALRRLRSRREASHPQGFVRCDVNRRNTCLPPSRRAREPTRH